MSVLLDPSFPHHPLLLPPPHRRSSRGSFRSKYEVHQDAGVPHCPHRYVARTLSRLRQVHAKLSVLRPPSSVWVVRAEDAGTIPSQSPGKFTRPSPKLNQGNANPRAVRPGFGEKPASVRLNPKKLCPYFVAAAAGRRCPHSRTASVFFRGRKFSKVNKINFGPSESGTNFWKLIR